jgi:hypothetical protein
MRDYTGTTEMLYWRWMVLDKDCQVATDQTESMGLPCYSLPLAEPIL